MGAYDLTTEQKQLKNDNKPYFKTFSSSSLELNSNKEVIQVWKNYQVEMENNWQPKLINAFFNIEEDKKSSKEFFIINEKGSSQTTSVDSYERYKKAWGNKTPKPEQSQKDRILSQLTVSQFNPAFNNHFEIIKKVGYQPLKKLNDYFKIDSNDIYAQKYIPLNSKLVHYLLDDPFADYRIKSKLDKERHIISDKSFMKTDDTYDKLPYIDYRLINSIFSESYQYFSGLPKEEHESYKNRPDIIYAFDRPWRIGGWNRTGLIETDSSTVQNENKYEVKSGAFIDFEKKYSADNWGFYFLQSSWNTYNRIHWADVQGQQQYGLLFAQEIGPNGENIGNEFSIKTKTSIWDDELRVWCIPYNEKMSDIIDSTDNNNQLKFQKNYKFIMKFKNKYSEVISNDTMTSSQFNISSYALSPAIITDSQYDPWTKILTVKFRFDDVYGNKYDILKIYYTTNENVKTTPSEDDNNWRQINENYIEGKLTDLASNKYGDNVISDNFIIIHTIKIKINSLGVGATSAFRINIQAGYSSDLSDLTFPVFYIRMWANEFLKPVQENLRQLQGYKNQWIWTQTFDEQTQTSKGEWKYVNQEKAVVVIGKLQQIQENINQIEEDFKKWYYKNSAFRYPDLDCFEQWLYISKKWNNFYYEFFFDLYLKIKGEENDYKDYIKKFPTYKTSTKNQNWLYKRNYISDYNEFYNKYRFNLLKKYYDENKTEFLSSYKSLSITYSKMRSSFIQKYKIQYKKYFNQSLSEGDESSSSSSEFNPQDDKIIEFIQNKKLEDEFIKYCAKTFLYIDTRFQERACLMYKNFNITTSVNSEILFQSDN